MVPVVIAMGIVIPNHAAVVAGMQGMIDIGQVVSNHAPVPVNPYFAAEQPVPALSGNGKCFVNDLSFRHDQ